MPRIICDLEVKDTVVTVFFSDIIYIMVNIKQNVGIRLKTLICERMISLPR